VYAAGPGSGHWQVGRVTVNRLEQTLERIDGRGYKAYRDIAGRHALPRFTLHVDHVQADPFAPPSRMRATVPWEIAALPDAAHASAARRRAARDFLARAFRAAAQAHRSLRIDAGGQSVLDRTACLFTDEGVELRFTVQLPADGRRVRGGDAREILLRHLPAVVRRAAEAAELDVDALERHCAMVEDQVALRDALSALGVVAFVADGARLPRRSGVDDRPLDDAIAFRAPDSLRITIDAPNAGPVTGMGIPPGITLIVGGGFHGKSTLLSALQFGVYDHVPDDGREGVVARADAVKIRAEDGRAIAGVDLSPFIDNLPYGKSTVAFRTDLASGSTSQAAALVEALECGATALLVDEDTSATNFMIRDERMQALISSDREPITPFVDRIRDLRDALDVSTILVMGGSGDYFDCADTVIAMHDYQPHDVTAAALAATHVTGRREEHGAALQRPAVRRLDPASLHPETGQGRHKVRVRARARDALVFGEDDVDLRAVEQLADPSQVRAIGLLLARLAGERGDVPDPPAWIATSLETGWEHLAVRRDGDLAMPRLADVMAALNRVRGVRLG